MLFKSTARVLAASALLYSLAHAQTSTSCDPLTSTDCDPDPALGKSINIDFADGESEYFTATSSTSKVSYESDGVEFTISESGDSPTIESDFYIMFGKVEVVLQAAPGTGIVSSVVLESDDLDEIDWEWLGGDAYHVQTNYFSKGNTATYDRGGMHDVSSPQTSFHTYTIEWTSDQIVWSVDGNAVRTLTPATSEGYPQTPMMIKIGTWVGGDPAYDEEGTIEWAGGETDYSDGPFTMILQSITVEDYSTGTEYIYGDQSGDWTSIKAVDGEVNSNSSSRTTETASSSSSSSSMSSSSSSVATSTSSSTSVESTTSTSTTSSSTTSSSTTSSSSSTSAEPTTTSSTSESKSSSVESSTSTFVNLSVLGTKATAASSSSSSVEATSTSSSSSSSSAVATSPAITSLSSAGDVSIAAVSATTLVTSSSAGNISSSSTLSAVSQASGATAQKFSVISGLSVIALACVLAI